MRQRGKTIVVAHDTVLNRFVFEDVARRPDFEVVFFRERRNPLVSLLKSVRMALGNPRSLFAGRILPPELREALASAGPGDTLLLWSVENRKYVSMCAAEASRAGRIVSWLWNPMRRLAGSERECRRYIGDMDALGVEVATFDPSDAALLHARLLPQVHRRGRGSAIRGAVRGEAQGTRRYTRASGAVACRRRDELRFLPCGEIRQHR